MRRASNPDVGRQASALREIGPAGFGRTPATPASGESAHMPGHRSTPCDGLARGLALAAGIWASEGHAAGGHFAVDDAAILDAGTCQVETWWEHANHAGSLRREGQAGGRLRH